MRPRPPIDRELRVSRGLPIMWGQEKLKEFAPKVDQRSAVGVGAGGNSGWDVLGAGPKANLRLTVDEKRWIF